jgi:hypothetical protein
MHIYRSLRRGVAKSMKLWLAPEINEGDEHCAAVCAVCELRHRDPSKAQAVPRLREVACASARLSMPSADMRARSVSGKENESVNEISTSRNRSNAYAACARRLRRRNCRVATVDGQNRCKWRAQRNER